MIARKKWQIFYRPFFIGFLIALLLTSGILIWQFFYLYWAEWSKESLVSYTSLAWNIALSMLPYCIVLSVSVAAIAGYYRLSKKRVLSMNEVLKRSIPCTLMIAALIFAISSFIVPRANERLLNSLYTIRNNSETARNIFKGWPSTSNILEINMTCDSISKKMEESKTKYAFMSESNTLSTRDKSYFSQMLAAELRVAETRLSTYEDARLKMFLSPVLCLLAFFSGMFAGILQRRLHYFLVLLVNYFLISYGLPFAWRLIANVLNPIWDKKWINVLMVFLLLSLTLILGNRANRSLRRNANSDQLNKTL